MTCPVTQDSIGTPTKKHKIINYERVCVEIPGHGGAKGSMCPTVRDICLWLRAKKNWALY